MTTTRNTPKETASTATSATTTTEKSEKAATSWPEDCLWPEPYRQNDLPPTFDLDEIEEIALTTQLDEETSNLLEIKEYFDGLVADGVLVEEDKGHYKI